MRRPSATPSRKFGRDAGQAMVEAAIVMPLFVFLILGTLQLGLAHQARLMTKYAAYRAVRAGSIYNGRVDKMEMAAMSVLLPMISHEGFSKTLKPIDGPSRFAQKFLMNKMNKMPEDGSTKDVEVTICNPTTDMLSGAKSNELDFDDPAVASGTDWKTSERTKLAVQVTFNYRMPIPFANAVISAIYRAKAIPYSLRMGKDDGTNDNLDRIAKAGGTMSLSALANSGAYVLPIRASYAMRMQSNLFVKVAPFPKKNLCVIPFKAK